MSITSTVIDGADTRFVEAADVLRPYVGCFWVITANRGATIRVVPDASTSISIQLRAGSSSSWFLRGPLIKPQELHFRSPATLIGIRLRPGAAYLVSRIAADALLGRRVRLTGPAFRELSSRRAAVRTPAQHIEVLQEFLVGRLANARVHPVVSSAMRAIEESHGCASVADISSRCGVSPRHLSRLMRVWVGYGPKCLARVVRFQETLRQMASTPGQNGAALASDAGYFDQAHLTLDLTRMAGATPRHLASRSVADFYKTRCDVAL
jgi:AraC-like DNA-binding protein